MTDVSICAIYELEHELRSWQPDYVISITDTGSAESAKAFHLLGGTLDVPHVELHFHDVDRVTPGALAPSLPMFRDLMTRLEADLPEAPARLLVHCHAGLSRSPATAMLALASFRHRAGTLDETAAREIVDQVFTARPEAEPNMRILSIGERLFRGPGEAMADAVLERQEAVRGPAPSPRNIW